MLTLSRKLAKQFEFYKKKMGGNPSSGDIYERDINEIIRKPKKFRVIPNL